jgi:hypothetical protein
MKRGDTQKRPAWSYGNKVGQMKSGDTFKMRTKEYKPINSDPRFSSKMQRDKETNRETSRVRNDMRNGKIYNPQGKVIGKAEGDY